MEHKNFSRSIRRHHACRVKAARQKVALRFSGGQPIEARWLGRLVHTAKACSCHMCGNPRRHFGFRTLAEMAGIEDCLKQAEND